MNEMSRFLLPISSRQIDESISIADFFPPKSRSRFLLLISSRQIDESISIADFFPPN
jgi:hypothetical protein